MNGSHPFTLSLLAQLRPFEVDATDDPDPRIILKCPTNVLDNFPSLTRTKFHVTLSHDDDYTTPPLVLPSYDVVWRPTDDSGAVVPPWFQVIHDVDSRHNLALTTRTSLAARSPLHHHQMELEDYLKELPSELVSMILDPLLSEEEDTPYPEYRSEGSKCGLTRTSLVCREWCNIQRPKLFSCLSVRAPDVHVLLEMLHRPNNAGLSAHIRDFELDLGDKRSSSSMSRVCKLLFIRLPSLRSLRITADLDANATFGPSSQSSFACLINIQRLNFTNTVFSSLSALAHMLGGMANLEVLTFSNCALVRSKGRPPTRMSLASFPKLRSVYVEGKHPRSWNPGWLFSPLLARRRGGFPEEEILGGSDAELLVLLGISISPRSANLEPAQIKTAYDEVSKTLKFICLFSGKATPLSIVEIGLCPVVSAESDGTSSVIRNVKYYTNCYRLFGQIDWESIDRSLAQEATLLEKLIIFSNSPRVREELPPRLPRLCTLGKFSVEDYDGQFNNVYKFADYYQSDDYDGEPIDFGLDKFVEYDYIDEVRPDEFECDRE